MTETANKQVKKGALREPELYFKGNLVAIRWVGGGEVPQALSGLYTSRTGALQAIEEYKATRRTPKNAKANTGT